MTKTFFSKILFLTVVLLFMFAGAFVLIGCSSAPTDDSALRKAGYVRATYDSNGGNIEGYEKRYVYAKPSSPLPEPSDNGKIKKPALDVSKEVEGWYEAVLDENGEAVLDKNGQVVLKETKWDFSKDRIGDEDITLYARWIDKLRFTVQCGVKDGEETLNEILRYVSNYDTDEASLKLSMPSQPPSWSGYTFIGYYKNAEYTELLTEWPVLHNGESIEMQIHARYVKGDYTVVWDTSGFASMGAFSNLLIMKDIDMSNYNWIMRSFSGSIVGDAQENGLPIKLTGIKLTIEQSGSSFNASSFGLFGALNGAKIENIFFEDCSLEFSLVADRPTQIPTDVGLLAGRISQDTAFVNSKISGTVKIVNKTASTMITYNGFYGSKAEGLDLSGLTADVTEILE